MSFTEKGSILIVDDEPQVRRVLRIALRATGFDVDEAPTATNAIEAIRDNPYDLALLDINMPLVNGFELCQQIRVLGRQIAIVMVTVRDAAVDVIRALDAGADDYITKPFDIGELTARCDAVLRRMPTRTTTGESALNAGDLELDLDRRLLHKAGKAVHLTPTEFNLLALFLKNQEVPLTHARLLHAIWGPEYHDELEYLRTYVRQLRKKIEVDPAHPKRLLTEPGVGYRFTAF